MKLAISQPILQDSSWLKSYNIKQRYLKAKYNFVAESIHELSFNQGDCLRLLSNAENGWLKASNSTNSGYVPESYVEYMDFEPVSLSPSLNSLSTYTSLIDDYQDDLKFHNIDRTEKSNDNAPFDRRSQKSSDNTPFDRRSDKSSDNKRITRTFRLRDTDEDEIEMNLRRSNRLSSNSEKSLQRSFTISKNISQVDKKARRSFRISEDVDVNQLRKTFNETKMKEIEENPKPIRAVGKSYTEVLNRIKSKNYESKNYASNDESNFSKLNIIKSGENLIDSPEHGFDKNLIESPETSKHGDFGRKYSQSTNSEISESDRSESDTSYQTDPTSIEESLMDSLDCIMPKSLPKSKSIWNINPKEKESIDKAESKDRTESIGSKHDSIDSIFSKPTSPIMNENHSIDRYSKPSPIINELYSKPSPIINELYSKPSPTINEIYSKTSPINESYSKINPNPILPLNIKSEFIKIKIYLCNDENDIIALKIKRTNLISIQYLKRLTSAKIYKDYSLIDHYNLQMKDGEFMKEGLLLCQIKTLNNVKLNLCRNRGDSIKHNGII